MEPRRYPLLDGRDFSRPQLSADGHLQAFVTDGAREQAEPGVSWHQRRAAIPALEQALARIDTEGRRLLRRAVAGDAVSDSSTGRTCFSKNSSDGPAPYAVWSARRVQATARSISSIVSRPRRFMTLATPSQSSSRAWLDTLLFNRSGGERHHAVDLLRGIASAIRALQ